jgi:hypothetical protein
MKRAIISAVAVCAMAGGILGLSFAAGSPAVAQAGKPSTEVHLSVGDDFTVRNTLSNFKSKSSKADAARADTQPNCKHHKCGGSGSPSPGIRHLRPRKQAWLLLSKWDHKHHQYACLNDIIMAESSWNKYAKNPSSGAYGIPQALPGDKMAGWWGKNWVSSSYVQLFWMIREYIPHRYGTMCQAWAFHEAHGSY